jgi:RND family efflux transporter MFP subunit
MKYRSPIQIGSSLLLGIGLSLAGCAHKPSAAPSTTPIAVQVSYPVEKEITDYAPFTGRVQAVESVQVQARVTGYLTKVCFKEGSLVRKDDVLFEIDARPYQAQLEKDQAQLQQYEAKLQQNEHDLARANMLLKKSSISQADYDAALANRDMALANVAAARASIEASRLNVEFCTVRSPIDGRTSSYSKTVGNLVSQDQTLLTTVVSVDPAYVYFDVDELTIQRLAQLIREGKFQSVDEKAWPVALGLGSEEGFPHRGTINFEDNQVNAKTGTLRVRGVFPNKNEALSPGYFARVRVPINLPHQGLLVSDRTLDNDQGQRIVYVVNDENKVVQRPVRMAALHDGLRAIEDGLTPGERVIVNGLLQIRPGVTVEPTLVDMPASKIKGRQPGTANQIATSGAAKPVP